MAGLAPFGIPRTKCMHGKVNKSELLNKERQTPIYVRSSGDVPGLLAFFIQRELKNVAIQNKPAAPFIMVSSSPECASKCDRLNTFCRASF